MRRGQHPLPWVKLARDFHLEPSLLEASESLSRTEVIAAYALLLAEAARSDGDYEGRASIARILRQSGGLSSGRSESVVDAFISAGILVKTDRGLHLEAWDSLRPGANQLSRQQRIASRTTDSVATATQEVERREEKNRQEIRGEDSGSFSPTWINEETIYVPRRRGG
jgi:hypothetical protein